MKRLIKFWNKTKDIALKLWIWVVNFAFVFFTTKSRLRVFTGYGHFWFAKKYANRRTKINSPDGVTGRRRHYVIPSGDYSLVVLNRSEINSLKARGILSKNTNIIKLLENAYYISK
jgi:hypothetical protein